MSDVVFGHDGRGTFTGVNLVDAVNGEVIPFSEILTDKSPLDPSKLQGVEDYGLGFLSVEDRAKALSYLGITEEMLTPGEGTEGPPGPQGIPGPIGPAGLVWKGPYDPEKSYIENDAVGYEGASYYCVKPSQGNLPTTDFWALLASVGARGPEGPRGVQGLQGKPGVDGQPGKQGPVGPQGPDGVFDITSLSVEDLRQLYSKLKVFYPQRYWVERLTFEKPEQGNSKQIRLGDSNLALTITASAVDYVRIQISRFDDSKSAIYDVKRSSNYDSSMEGQSYSNYAFTSALVTIDSIMYNEARESVFYSLFDRTTKEWYRCYVTCIGNLRTSDAVEYFMVETTKITNEIKF